MSHGNLSPAAVKEILWRAWCDFGAHSRDIIAIDPGLRKCGLVRCFTDGGMGMRIAASLDEPVITTYPEGACVHANKLTDVDASATGGNYVRWLLRTHQGPPPLVLIENQPPSRVTGKAGRCTRAFANGMVSAFKANGCPVIMKTVRAYKEKALNITVNEDRLTNKQTSMAVIKAINDWLPGFVEMDEAYLKNADVADALILLFSELLEELPVKKLCHRLSSDYPYSKVQLLQVLLLALRFQQVDDPYLQFQRIVQGTLQQQLERSFLVQPVVPKALGLRSIRASRGGMRGVPSVADTLANHSIMSLPRTNHTNLQVNQSDHPPPATQQ